MYMSSILALPFGARSVLYDGSPFQPDLKTFIRLVGEQGYVLLFSPTPGHANSLVTLPG